MRARLERALRVVNGAVLMAIAAGAGVALVVSAVALVAVYVVAVGVLAGALRVAGWLDAGPVHKDPERGLRG